MFEYAKVTLLSMTPNPDQLIERAGRISHKSEHKIKEGSAEKFIKKYALKLGHESILEHANVTFLIKNISRVSSHQVVRHRLASYTQVSQRVVDPSGYIIPPKLLGVDRDYYSRSVERSINHASTIEGLGGLQEDVRYLWPNAISTELIMTINFRSLRNMFKERLSKGAQWEIKTLVCCMYLILRDKTCCFDDEIDLWVNAHSLLLNEYNIMIDVDETNDFAYGYYIGGE